MKSLQNIDAQVVGSICADSSTYCSISDVFKMNNLVSDIRSILSGEKTYVGRLHDDNSKNIEIKFHKTEVSLIGVASCCGEKAYQMLPIKEMEATNFAWCYIDLLESLAYNVRCKIALLTANEVLK